MHQLKIHGFLGIKDADIILDGLTVLVGPQASGKSIVVRLIYFFNEYLSNFDITAISNKKHKKVYDRRKREEFYEIFPPYSWQGAAFSITYLNGIHEIAVSSDENSATIAITTSPSVSKHFRNLKNDFKKLKRRMKKMQSQDFGSVSLYRKFLRNSSTVRYESALFVPAARSFYATIRDEIFSILVLGEKIDRIMLQFGEFYETAKSRVVHTGSYRQYSNYFQQIARGSFERSNGQDWLIMDHGRIEMSRASAGQQEVVPLLFCNSRLSSARNRTLDY